MRKIWLIIQREYFVRVKNTTFILLTFLGPLLYFVLLAAPILLTQVTKSVSTVLVHDQSGEFEGMFKSDDDLRFHYLGNIHIESERALLKELEGDHLLIIPAFENNNLDAIRIISQRKAGMSVRQRIRSAVSSSLEEMRLGELGLDRATIAAVKPDLDVQMVVLSEDGEKEASSGAASAAAAGGGFMIYFFIFLYGGMVLKGVQEEKSSRIVEIIISSVKPFQLMMGKILGIALVGLTQFSLWVILTVVITFGASLFMIIAGISPAGPDPAFADMAMAEAGIGSNMILGQLQGSIGTLPIGKLLFSFIFFFLFGYLLYSSLFAAFASAADSQADTYQFMFPASVPLLFAIVSLPALLDNPDSSFAFWLSMFPSTSPVVMMARIPFDVPMWELGLSMLLLVSGFVGTTWLAAKIYRTGILMYGKKPSYAELVKWLFYRG